MHKTMNKIKNRLFRVLLLCAGTGLLVAGCSNDDDAPREIASKTTLTLTKYYNDKGATTLPTWSKSDKAGMFVADRKRPGGRLCGADPVGIAKIALPLHARRAAACGLDGRRLLALGRRPPL